MIGQWEVERNHGYSAHARPWVVRRKHPDWWGGVQYMQTSSGCMTRFASEEAANKAAAKANNAATEVAHPAPAGGDAGRLAFVVEHNWIGTATRCKHGIQDGDLASARKAIDAAMALTAKPGAEIKP